MKLTKINDSTPVRDFPSIHNGNVDELISEINRLNNVIAAKDAEIKNLKSAVQSAIEKLRAEYLAMFDQKMDEFEGKFVKIEDNQ